MATKNFVGLCWFFEKKTFNGSRLDILICLIISLGLCLSIMKDPLFISLVFFSSCRCGCRKLAGLFLILAGIACLVSVALRNNNGKYFSQVKILKQRNPPYMAFLFCLLSKEFSPFKSLLIPCEHPYLCLDGCVFLETWPLCSFIQPSCFQQL